MTLLVQAQDKEELEEYFTLPQSSDYDEDGRLESNREDQNSHLKILQYGKSNLIEVLEDNLLKAFT
jgi:hypothetical protein